MADNSLKVGDPAPDFELMNQDRQPVRLEDYRGQQNVMLLFYPMDFSPVCTAEHCSFGPEIERLQGSGDTIVFGINADHPFSHAAFRKQYSIPYDLLSDPTRQTLKAYGMFAGETPFNCAARGTVVIDKEGKIAHISTVNMSETRSMDDLAKAALIQDLAVQRQNEGGGAHA